MSNAERTVGAFDAETRFLQLLEEVEAGGSIVITRHGTPVARLVPIGAPYPRRSPGELRASLAAVRLQAAITVDDALAWIVEGRR